MYSFRTSLGPVDLAFTDRFGGVSASPYDSLNLALESADPARARAENQRLVLDDFAPDDVLFDLRQVHGADVHVVEEPHVEDRRIEEPRVEEKGGGVRGPRPPEGDALVTAARGVTLLVRAADCVPVLLADLETPMIGAAHCGRLGLLAGVVPNAVAAMRERGATAISAWIGPHVCGACYEVPARMRDDVASVVPASRATTSWGTPSLDLGAGVRAQLAALGVEVHDHSRCTSESPDLFSYRRDGAAAGRHAGLIRMRAR